MRVGIYGGSFNPPHVGHLILAADSRANLKLDLLLFIPPFIQPLKHESAGVAAPEHRLAMLKLALGNAPDCAIETVELDRGGLSYTIHTLEELAPRYPGAELFLIIGEDSLSSLDSWREPDRIREMATIAVLRRHADSGRSPLPAGVVEASGRLVGISSSEIRARIRGGQSIHGFVPESVENYIRTNGLYR